MVIGRSTDFHSFFSGSEYPRSGAEAFGLSVRCCVLKQNSHRYEQVTSSLPVSVLPISFFTLEVFTVFSSVAIYPKEDSFVSLKQGAYQDCS